MYAPQPGEHLTVSGHQLFTETSNQWICWPIIRTVLNSSPGQIKTQNQLQFLKIVILPGSDAMCGHLAKIKLQHVAQSQTFTQSAAGCDHMKHFRTNDQDFLAHSIEFTL